MQFRAARLMARAARGTCVCAKNAFQAMSPAQCKYSISKNGADEIYPAEEKGTLGVPTKCCAAMDVPSDCKIGSMPPATIPVTPIQLRSLS